MRKITTEGEFDTVEKLHKVLSDLIAEGKGNFNITYNTKYDYEVVGEVKVYDEPDDKRIVLDY